MICIVCKRPIERSYGAPGLIGCYCQYCATAKGLTPEQILKSQYEQAIKELTEENERLRAENESLKNDLSWVGARSVMYVSKECPNCGRVRVEHYTNGKHVCEKCHWCIEENQYRETPFEYM